MKRRYGLAPAAAQDLVDIWRYVKTQAGPDVAQRVESQIIRKIEFLARTPGAGHWRRDLTDQNVRFFTVYSYLIVYRPDLKPLEVVAILHGHRDVEAILKTR